MPLLFTVLDPLRFLVERAELNHLVHELVAVVLELDRLIQLPSFQLAVFVVLRCRQVRAVGEKELIPCGHLGGGFLLLLDRLLALLLVELLLAFL